MPKREEVQPELQRVTRAARVLSRARIEYRSAIVEAHEEGCTPSAIARAAGVSRQAISDVLRRAS